jgi:hypothetical protein
MSGHAPANQPRLSLPCSERVKPEQDWASGETLIGGRYVEPPARKGSKIAEPPCTDPYARWCGRGRRVQSPPLCRFTRGRVNKESREGRPNLLPLTCSYPVIQNTELAKFERSSVRTERRACRHRRPGSEALAFRLSVSSHVFSSWLTAIFGKGYKENADGGQILRKRNTGVDDPARCLSRRRAVS